MMSNRLALLLMVVELTSIQNDIIASDGHVLVTGGPGSGKTTVSILKAAKMAAGIKPCQKILFLGFARSTAARVLDAIKHEQAIPNEIKERIEVETYHAFFWRIIKAHGYLIGLPKRLKILCPHHEAIFLAESRSGKMKAKLSNSEKQKIDELVKKQRVQLAYEEGKVCFELFAELAGSILHGSKRISALISSIYPFIVLDEFQDTSASQWYVLKAIGKESYLLALADPEQRIFDWLGAEPHRLEDFREAFHPLQYNLGPVNHRSSNTEICLFANDVLRNSLREDPYSKVEVVHYNSYPPAAISQLITTTLSIRKRVQSAATEDWSVAILVPTKRLTQQISNWFRSPPGNLPSIPHLAILEIEGAMLSAELIAYLLQPDIGARHFKDFVDLLVSFYRGKGGDSPSQSDLREADAIVRSYTEFTDRNKAGKHLRKNSVLRPVLEVYNNARSETLKFSGKPEADWLMIVKVLEKGSCQRLRTVAEEVQNIKLLGKREQLRQALSEMWCKFGCYNDALQSVRKIFIQEHFAMSMRRENGVIVMNMHKAKGKQFDEVLVFEQWPVILKRRIVSNFGRIVRWNENKNISEQSRQLFRVAVTRAKRHVTIMTPKNDPCVLLRPASKNETLRHLTARL